MGQHFGLTGGCSILDADDRNIWFKIKHKILPTKDKLKMYGITKDDICPMCKTNVETIEHLFINCTEHAEAWLFVENLIRKYTSNMLFCLDDVKRILGVELENQVCIFLVARLHRTIWSLRCKTVNDGKNESSILRTYTAIAFVDSYC